MPKLRALTEEPPLARGDAEDQVAELRDYLLKIVEELGYLLTHLEADNINDSTFQRISAMIPKAYNGAPLMDGTAFQGHSSAWARGDHVHPTDVSRAAESDLAAHVGNTANPHGVTAAQVGLGNVANERQYSEDNPPPYPVTSVNGETGAVVLDASDVGARADTWMPSAADVGAIPVSQKGAAGGVAELGNDGKVPSAQLPSYVDDVLEYPTQADFPVTGENGKIYVALDTNRTYRWSGSAYVEISESLALGETSSTAYRGDRGKIAYDHSQTVGNPHGTTAADVGARPNDWMPSAADIGAVPNTRTVNGKALSQDITLTAADVGAIPVSQKGAAGGVAELGNDGKVPTEQLPPISSAAADISYDNTSSGLTATDVQDAIDEVYGDIPIQASDIGAQDTITASGILKGNGSGGVSAAAAGTDYQAPLGLSIVNGKLCVTYEVS